MNVFKHNFNNSYNSKNKQNTSFNKGYKTTYNSRNKSKDRYNIIKYSPSNNNQKSFNLKTKSSNKNNKELLNINLNEIKFMKNSRENKLFINNPQLKKISTPIK